MNRLQKFVEKRTTGDVSLRTAYALGAEKLPAPTEGAQWHVVENFNLGDELLGNAVLRDVFKTAVANGHAILPAVE